MCFGFNWAFPLLHTGVTGAPSKKLDSLGPLPSRRGLGLFEFMRWGRPHVGSPWFDEEEEEEDLASRCEDLKNGSEGASRICPLTKYSQRGGFPSHTVSNLYREPYKSPCLCRWGASAIPVPPTLAGQRRLTPQLVDSRIVRSRSVGPLKPRGCVRSRAATSYQFIATRRKTTKSNQAFPRLTPDSSTNPEELLQTADCPPALLLEFLCRTIAVEHIR